MSPVTQTLLAEIQKLDESDQRQLAHQILAHLGDGHLLELSEEQRDILRGEIAAHRESPESSAGWGEVRRRIPRAG